MTIYKTHDLLLVLINGVMIFVECDTVGDMYDHIELMLKVRCMT